MNRTLTYFESIDNEIIIIILNVGTWYESFGLNCQKKEKSIGTFEMFSHALDLFGFGAWHKRSECSGL